MKQAKGFAQQDLTNTFNLDSGDQKDKIVLNIGTESEKDGFIKLKKTKRLLYYKVTGNAIIDTYHKVNAWLLDNAKIKLKDKAAFFNLLSVMISAGLPVVKSLDSLAIQTKKNLRFSRIIYELARNVEHGDNLSKAMRNYADVFTSAEIGMVEAGEASGQLNQVLANIAEATEKSSSIRAKVKGALMYPMFILILLVAVVGVMFIYVVPKIKEFFTAGEKSLPLLTEVVIAISDFMVANWQVISVTFLLALFFFILWKKTDQGRRSFDGIKLKMPIIGPIIQKLLLSRFARSFSDLLASDVAIISSLEITAHSMGNEIYKERILMSAEDLKQGIPLGESLKDNPLFPEMLVNIVEVGEKTAQLDSVTGKVATFLDEDVNTTISSMSKIIEPVLLVIIGVTVGVVVMAIMLPIVELTDFSAIEGI